MLYKQRDRHISQEDAGKTDQRVLDYLEAQAPENALYIEKTTRSIFARHTQDISAFLNKQGIEEIHFVGFDSNDCVLVSAYDALGAGYYSYVLEELTHHYAGIQELHEAALTLYHRQNMTNNCIHPKIPYIEKDIIF